MPTVVGGTVAVPPTCLLCSVVNVCDARIHTHTHSIKVSHFNSSMPAYMSALCHTERSIHFTVNTFVVIILVNIVVMNDHFLITKAGCLHQLLDRPQPITSWGDFLWP